MKLPGVAIAALFLTGIALGLHPLLARHATLRGLLLSSFLGAARFFCAGILSAKIGRLSVAACAAAFCWLALAVLSSFIAQQPLPENHVLSLMTAKRLELSTPLRWHGRLRDEPARLSWGYGYDVELSGVEFSDNLVPASGGLRIDYAPTPTDTSLPDIHAGDEIAVLTQAKLPRMYRDDGAFDHRAYLAQQNVHLVATLRAPELLERVAAARVCSRNAARKNSPPLAR